MVYCDLNFYFVFYFMNYRLIYFSFRNGSFVRDHFKKVEANDNWDNFNELLNSTPRGNHGNIALHFNEKEIIPNVKGSLRWNKDHKTGSPDAEKGVTKYGLKAQQIRNFLCNNDFFF